jgi:hypothetical protein
VIAGLWLWSNLKWDDHVENLVKKGNRKLRFVMRNLKGTDMRVKEKAYLEMVRPMLEYAAPAWDPYTKKLKEALERVQKRAVRHVLCKFGRQHSPTEMLEMLHWPTLEKRRKVAKLCTIYKALTGEIAWENIGTRLEGAQRLGRLDHRLKLMTKNCRTNAGKFSLVADGIQQWNSLPERAVHPLPRDVQAFRIIVNSEYGNTNSKL